MSSSLAKMVAPYCYFLCRLPFDGTTDNTFLLTRFREIDSCNKSTVVTNLLTILLTEQSGKSKVLSPSPLPLRDFVHFFLVIASLRHPINGAE